MDVFLFEDLFANFIDKVLAFALQTHLLEWCLSLFGKSSSYTIYIAIEEAPAAKEGATGHKRR